MASVSNTWNPPDKSQYEANDIDYSMCTYSQAKISPKINNNDAEIILLKRMIYRELMDPSDRSKIIHLTKNIYYATFKLSLCVNWSTMMLLKNDKFDIHALLWGFWRTFFWFGEISQFNDECVSCRLERLAMHVGQAQCLDESTVARLYLTFNQFSSKSNQYF